jgi:hypothetical protein
MLFTETPTFTKQITTLLPDHAYKELQSALMANPDAGDLIKGGGGIRKLRWSRPGGGKRGGIRTIYFWRNGTRSDPDACRLPEIEEGTI